MVSSLGITDDKVLKELVRCAEHVLKNSYAPYSGIHVAAAVLTSTGRIYTGVNVENSSYGLTICAERAAIANMVTAGERKPIAIAIVTDLDTPIPPCGACRQVLAEFNEEIIITMCSSKSGKCVTTTLKKIFPSPFKL